MATTPSKQVTYSDCSKISYLHIHNQTVKEIPLPRPKRYTWSMDRNDIDFPISAIDDVKVSLHKARVFDGGQKGIPVYDYDLIFTVGSKNNVVSAVRLTKGQWEDLKRSMDEASPETTDTE